jgi:DAACS family dicarboxylate/amino acid:cation (Na+ or H+) symporter
MKTHYKLIISLFLGALLGTLMHQFGSDQEILVAIQKNLIEPFGQIFLRLIFMIVVPLVFSGLVLGVYQLSHHQGLGKVVSRTLMFTLIASTASVLIGISLVNIFRPGDGLQLPPEYMAAQTASVEKIKTNASSTKPLTQIIIELVPKNPIDSAAKALDGEMIALMFFALFFGVALSRTIKDKDATIITFFEQVYDTSMTVVTMVMKLAPYAVFCLLFTTSSKFGFDLLKSLVMYVLLVVGGLALQHFGVYSLLLKIFTKISPLEFNQKCREVFLYAFATASSNATLPRTLEAATEKLKLNPASSRFVLTVGSTANQNGTALFEGITVLFIAQVFGKDLGLTEQIQVVLMSILAGVGTAGVPGGSLPLIMILLQQLGLPPEGLGIVLGVDRFLDMCRTTVNVSGDLMIAALVDSKKSDV